MKLVLLPGMDGTGILFEPVLEYLKGLDVEVLPLPANGDQDYDTLANELLSHLPEEDFIVLAESFSGGIVEKLLWRCDIRLKGVIFVASFLSSPSRYLSRLAAILPIKFMIKIPIISPFILRTFFLGKNASPKIIALFIKAMKQVPGRTLRSRLRTIATFTTSEQVFETDALYICPEHDVLVKGKELEFRKAFPGIQVVTLPGPHLILQASPEICAKHIMQFANGTTVLD